MQQPKAGTRAIDAECAAIRVLLQKADVDELATRYKIGAIVAKIRDDTSAFGERGVEQLATLLKKHRATLYRYAAVADLGPWRELRGLAKRKNRDGETLCWRHWWELARVPQAWTRWHARTLAEGWTARELGQRLDGVVAAGPSRTDEADDTTTEALADSLRGVQRYEVEVAGSLAATLERIERMPSRERPKQVAELLARAMDLVGAAHSKSGALLARIQRLTGEPSNARMDTVAMKN